MMTKPNEPRPEPVPLQVGMLVYPALSLLDLIGRQTALSMHGQTHLVAKTLDPGIQRNHREALPAQVAEQCGGKAVEAAIACYVKQERFCFVNAGNGFIALQAHCTALKLIIRILYSQIT